MGPTGISFFNYKTCRNKTKLISFTIFFPPKNENKADIVFNEITRFTEMTAVQRHTVKKLHVFSPH